MTWIRIDAEPGELDEATIKRARGLARHHNTTVEMRHNDRVIVVAPTTSGPDALRQLRTTKASEKERPMMKRGDVVRTRAEFLALPAGSSVTGIEGGEYARGKEPDQWPGGGEFSWLPALVRVVGSVEPEWLEAAANAGQSAFLGEGGWEGSSESGWRRVAKAAVAAADKARGIVNSREEFDALPAGTICWAWLDGEVWQLVRGPNQAMPPSRYPVVVVGSRT